jgi:hypothetical protein
MGVYASKDCGFERAMKERVSSRHAFCKIYDQHDFRKKCRGEVQIQIGLP